MPFMENPHRPRPPTIEAEDIDPDLVRQWEEMEANRDIALDPERIAVFSFPGDREKVEQVLRAFDGQVVSYPARKKDAA